jgi:shikimate dehydrogenase
VRLFGLIGNPLTHSFSEKYFADKFQRENIADADYKLFPIDQIENLPELIAANPGLIGLNVTIPYKEKVIPFLDELDETAKTVGAVNTILITRPSSPVPRPSFLKGYNTDVYGFRQSIKPFLTSAHERALILGTGGASKAIEFVLKQIGVECIFVSREKKKIAGKTVLTYGELNSYVIDSCKLIVNCSPVGTFPNVNEFPNLPYGSITKEHLLYDLVYNPAETEFIKKGKAQGAETMNGLDMLKLQAEKAWEIWGE